MWNDFRTDGDLSVRAAITTYHRDATTRHGYLARPDDDRAHPGVVLVHHMPGWDEFSFEMAERIARHGFQVFCPDLYCGFGHGQPDDVAAVARAAGGVSDESVVADAAASLALLRALPGATGRVGVIGPCSGGRHALLVASLLENVDAVVDLWGGRVVMAPEELSAERPVAPIDYTERLTAPLLGIFGNDDKSPSPAQVDAHEAELRRLEKTYTFHRYDGAGHGFFYYHTDLYRPTAAMDAWNKVFAFLTETLRA